MKFKTDKKRQVLDITAALREEVEASRVERGVCVATILHTTAALTTADLDPGTDRDFLDFLESLVPDLHWRHPHNHQHAPDHLLASLIGPSVAVPVADGELQLGTWQSVVLVELDGPRERKVTATVIPG